MTFRRDLKRRIRERQELTGERYTTARAHVLAAQARSGRPSSLVIELHDVSQQARAAGLVCPVEVTPALQRARRELPALLAQLRRILLGATRGLEAMQRVALRGEPDPVLRDGPVVILGAYVQGFLDDLEHGLRGPGPGGRVLAFDAELGGGSQTIIAQLFPQHMRASLLVLSRFREDSLWLFDSPEMWAMLWPRVPGAQP